jgi:hypothetical protein
MTFYARVANSIFVCVPDIFNITELAPYIFAYESG